jgi:hypothetical protein
VVKKSPSSEVTPCGTYPPPRATARQGHVQCGGSVPICHTSSGDARRSGSHGRARGARPKTVRMRIHPFCPTV